MHIYTTVFMLGSEHNLLDGVHFLLPCEFLGSDLGKQPCPLPRSHLLGPEVILTFGDVLKTSARNFTAEVANMYGPLVQLGVV